VGICHLLWCHLSVVSRLARPVSVSSNPVVECSLYYRERSTFGRYCILVVAGGRRGKILVLDCALCAGICRCKSDLSGAWTIFTTDWPRYRLGMVSMGVGRARCRCQLPRQSHA